MTPNVFLNNETVQSLLNKLNEAVYIIDKNGIVLYANEAAALLEEISLNEIIGNTVFDLARLTELNDNWIPPSLSVLKDGKERVNQNIEWFNKNGTAINAIVSNYPIFQEKEIAGVFSISESIKEIKRRLVGIGAFNQKNTYRLKKKAMKNGTVYIFDDIIGDSENFKDAISMSKRFASRKLPIMLYGETGTGKEMFAQSIHNSSAFSKGQFVAINCAAIPENLLESMLFGTSKGAFTGAAERPGLFEKAENGSIFLDEVNSMPLALQAKLLRALQEKEIQRIGSNETRKISCRIISATNKPPEAAIRDNELREDLFYRLSTGIVNLPPLRERKNDIDLLIIYFIEKANAELDTLIKEVSDDLLSLLHTYTWPGNIRELSNIIESAMNMTLEGETVLKLCHLPPYFLSNFSEPLFSKGEYLSPLPKTFYDNTLNSNLLHADLNLPLNKIVGDYEKTILEHFLTESKGNLTHCSQKLGITRQGLMKKIKKYNINIAYFKTH